MNLAIQAAAAGRPNMALSSAALCEQIRTALTVIVDEVSARASEKVAAAGGTIEAGDDDWDDEWEEE